MEQQPKNSQLDVDKLNVQQLQQLLADCTIGHTIHYYRLVDSTMTVAQPLAKAAATRSGTLIVAEEQQAGRGRLQRSWLAPPNRALLLSLILKPPHLPVNPAHLPMLAGLTLLEAIHTVAPALIGRSGLKWPNDLLIVNHQSTIDRTSVDQAAGRKAAGILIESAWQAGQLQHAIIGIGINVNQSAAELPVPSDSTSTPTVAAPAPTSLRLALAAPIERADLLIALCRAWARWLDPPMAPATLLAQWKAHLWTLGQPVTVYQKGQAVTSGVAIDVDEDGGLLVRQPDDRTSLWHVGDVSLRAE